MENISCSNISFGSHNPQIALQRAEKLKELYAKKGLTYLMPNEVWSDKKISEKISIVDRVIKNLIKDSSLTPKTLQNAINDILPENAKNSILIKDISEFESSMKKRNYSQDFINTYKNVGGVNIHPDKNNNYTEIFVKFSDSKGNTKQKTDFNAITLHELQHALKLKFQNIISSDKYKSTVRNSSNNFDDLIFHKFEEKFYPYLTIDKTSKLNKNEFLNRLHVSSRDELYQKFAQTLDEIEKQYAKSPEEHIKNKTCGKFSTRDFFEYMKNKANNEKFSFKTETSTKTPDQYTVRDFFSTLYSEMAAFFSHLKNNTQN